MKEIIVKGTLEELENVQEFLEQHLVYEQCSLKTIFQLNIAVEEIYVNIAKYAYYPNEGEVTIRYKIEEEPTTIVIEFLDNGKPFNPLVVENPNVSMKADVRAIGGLGILLVKKNMDQVEYKYDNGQNVLTLKKIIM